MREIRVPLLEQYKEGEKGPLFYKARAKAHATMLKIFLPMHLEELACVIKRAAWKLQKFMHI